MKTGYPRYGAQKDSLTCTNFERFFIHLDIQAFAASIVKKHGESGEEAMLFPTHATALRCQDFFRRMAPDAPVRIVDLVPAAAEERSEKLALISPKVSAVMYPQEHFDIAKQFWQHSGDGVSSRRAEYCHHLFQKGLLVESTSINQLPRFCKGPRRYQKKTSVDLDNLDVSTNGEVQDPTRFVEERFGRNLDLSKTRNAKLAIRRRIAGALTADVGLTEALTLEQDRTVRPVAGFSEDNVYLYPTGMSAIFNAHRIILQAKGPLKAIVYG
jgi:cystathionine gamma-synthase